MTTHDLSGFTLAHRRDYATALSEIRRGRKASHWMWYIFPQLAALGRSETAKYYGIRDLDEAKAFLEDPYLGGHLREIASALLQLDCSDPTLVMGYPDDLKLKSSMTLFALAAPEEEVFRKVLDKYFSGEADEKTVKLVGMKMPE